MSEARTTTAYTGLAEGPNKSRLAQRGMSKQQFVMVSVGVSIISHCEGIHGLVSGFIYRTKAAKLFVRIAIFIVDLKHMVWYKQRPSRCGPALVMVFKVHMLLQLVD
jgi:hypothetical protein